MAKKHVEAFYRKQMKQYLSMAETAKHMEEAYKNKEVDEDNYIGFMQMADAMKANLDRISYIMFLMKQPYFKVKLPKFLKKHQELDDYFRSVGAHEEAVFAENNTVLEDMKAYIEKIKDKNNARVCR